MDFAEARSNLRTVNVSEFLLLLEHCELFDDVLTEREARNIFRDIQINTTADDVLIDFWTIINLNFKLNFVNWNLKATVAYNRYPKITAGIRIIDIINIKIWLDILNVL